MAGHLGHWVLRNTTYSDMEELTSQTFTDEKGYTVQVRGSFKVCRKTTTPDEEEGFEYTNNEKTFRYTHGTPNIYIKTLPNGMATLDIDEDD